MALAEIDNSLKSKEHGYAATLHRTQDSWIEKVADQIRTMPAALIIQSGLSFGAAGELKNDLLNQRTAIANYGRGQVTAELGRQS